MSFWMSALPPVPPRAPLPGDADADVAIVGAGYTGLWTAYYLAKADPALRIVVLEAETAGFGASGRNGGWCSALFPKSVPALARTHGLPAALALNAAMESTVDEVGRVAADEGIDCDYAKGGTVVLARSAVQLDRARHEVAEAQELGIDLRLLSSAEASSRVGASDVLGATYTPHCAAIQPAKLVRGLAATVERLGVRLYERTPVTAITAGCADTPHGTVRAPIVVRATEGFTPRLPGLRRTIAPVYSLMIATEPLPASFWASAGLARRETFSDHRHLIIYGQRTADDRLAFGGGARRTTSGRRSRRRSTRRPGCSRSCAGSWASCSRRSAPSRSVTRGAGRSASPGTGWRPSASTPSRDWRGRAATSATVSARPTSPGVPSPT